MTRLAEVLKRSTAVDIGDKIMRHVFEQRGNKSEAHLSRLELAAIAAVAAERGLEAGSVTRRAPRCPTAEPKNSDNSTTTRVTLSRRQVRALTEVIRFYWSEHEHEDPCDFLDVVDEVEAVLSKAGAR